MDRHIQNERMRAEVIKQFLWVKNRINKGKGTWPQSDYVRDSIWDGWLGKESALIAVLRAAEIDYMALQDEDIQSVEVPRK